MDPLERKFRNMVDEKNEISERIKNAIEEKVELTGSEKEIAEFSSTMQIAHAEADINQPSSDITLEKAAETRTKYGMFSALIEEAKIRKEIDDKDRWWSK